MPAENLPGSVKTKYALEFKLDNDAKIYKETLEQIRLARLVSHNIKTKGFFDGRVQHPTNRLRYNRDQKWQDIANPTLKQILRKNDARDLDTLKHRHKMAHMANANIVKQHRIP